MKKLVCGIRDFHRNIFRPMRPFFEQLAGGQSPRALFIACSDSRVSADLITQAEPGDLFVLRNAGNLVPPYGATNGGEGATIEYAVSALGVRNIIICGHSGCGAMTALMQPDSLAELPAVSRWLQHAEATRMIVKQGHTGLSPEKLIDEAAKANVLVQLENLRSHPSITVGLQRQELYLHGWFYDFGTGNVLAYDPIASTYRNIVDERPVSAVPPGRPLDEIPSRPGDRRGAWIVAGSQPVFTFDHGVAAAEGRTRNEAMAG